MSEPVWWSALRHQGLLLSPARLAELFPESAPALDPVVANRLRGDVLRVAEGGENGAAANALLDTVLHDVAGLRDEGEARWKRGNEIETRLGLRSIAGDTVKPRRIWVGPHETALPVFIDDEPRLGVGRGRRAYSRVLEWCRGMGHPLALLTNARQFRLIYAAPEHDAWAQWDTSIWFEAGQPAAQVEALRHLLAPRLLLSPRPGESAPLIEAIRRSRQGQSQLTSMLGERVRQAVELLIHAHAPYLRRGNDLDLSDVYRASTLVVMRIVIALFAEARDLFPRSNAIYEASYGIQGLWEKLRRASGGGISRLKGRHGSWPQILSLFRLVFHGSHHPEIPLREFGGELFRPGEANAPQGVRRAMHLFETASLSGDPPVMSDADVLTLLELLTRCRMPVRQGRSTQMVTMPVDFGDLSTEFIGILYEGLLDYELLQVPPDSSDPVLFLNLGDQPALPLSRLEALEGTALRAFFKEFQKKKTLASGGEGEGDEQGEGEDEGEGGDEADGADDVGDVGDDDGDVGADDGDVAEAEGGADAARQRALAWARRAVVEAKLVKAYTGNDPGRRAEYEERLSRAANQLLARPPVLPGDYFLVRWGGTRKGQGSFYTRPGLVEPTVRRTLAPLCYELPEEPTLEDLRTLANPKPPAAILSLKVADISMGSASFLVSALRFLSDALWRSLLHHGWLVEANGERRTVSGERGGDDEYENRELSGSGGMAEGASSGVTGVSDDSPVPGGGALRADLATAQGGGIGPVEHRRGLGAPVPRGVRAVSSEGERESGGSGDPAPLGDGRGIPEGGDHLADSGGVRSSGETDPHAGASHQGGEEGTVVGEGQTVVGEQRTGGEQRAELYHSPFTAHRSPLQPGPGLPAGEPPWFRECVRDLPVDLDAAEGTVRARLKRLVVELCIYGVDLDPLAVELGRLSLWIETMDRDLPFGFLDHKLKCGNALIGCWFDRFQEFPALCLHRPGDDAGDKGHATAVHFERGRLSTALKEFRDETLKPALAHWIEARDPGVFKFLREGQSPEALHEDALQLFGEMHALPLHETEQRAAFYRTRVGGHFGLTSLREAFDVWCALWFWPVEALEHFPLPEQFADPPEATRKIVAQLRDRLRFFHWELEFPDVFATPGAGFDALLGNPPWEIQKPNSKEFFSNHDPLYRTYGKQEALRRQSALFEIDEGVERHWVSYCAHFKALSNWCANAGFPWGDSADGAKKWSLAGGKAGEKLHDRWRTFRVKRVGYADPNHPFRRQGSADLNSYKLFIEQNHALLRDGGRLGIIVPSNVYTDKGSTGLRHLFLEHCRWEWLFGFENREGIFDIHRSFKFGPVVVQKGGKTKAIRTAFMRRRLADWEEAERHALAYAKDQVARFSPRSRAILEIRSVRDAEILEKMYRNGVLLGDDGPAGWGLRYATEFHMTNDSKLFPPRPRWEEEGYVPDEYGHWLKGGWRPITDCRLPITDPERWHAEHWTRARSVVQRPAGLILSRDGTQAIRAEDIEDVALPLYEGRMIDHCDFSAKGWVNGKGRSAVWRDIPWEHKVIEPQYLIAATVYNEQLLARHLRAVQEAAGKEASEAEALRLTDPQEWVDWRSEQRRRVAFMDVTSATNARTMVATFLDNAPCGNSCPILRNPAVALPVALSTSTLIYDWIARFRCGGLHLNYFVIEESVLPVPGSLLSGFEPLARRLLQSSPLFADLWVPHPTRRWRAMWAISQHERLRLQCIANAVVAAVFGLEVPDLATVFHECDLAVRQLRSDDLMRTLNPKGFWRVDKEKDPELRHTVLSLVAFHDLQEKGLDAFLAQNDGEGWMLPEALRLADYGLGHDDRAKEPQPVASRLGPRFLPWQLEGTVEESWEECRRHAENIRLIRAVGAPDATADGGEGGDGGGGGGPVNLFGEPEPTDLFGVPLPARRKKRR